MSNQTKRGIPWFVWLGAAIVAIAAILLFTNATRRRIPVRITVTLDTNGVARVGGVPLSSTNMRDGTFAVMGALGVKAGLAIPGLTNQGQNMTNLFETLTSMSRAGLFSTNQAPNPYE